MILLIIMINFVLQVSVQGNHADCKCGVRNEPQFVERVIGGVDAGVGEFPWAAFLEIMEYGIVVDRCGGSLINDRFVLTAAHCVDKDTSDVDVILGEHDIGREFESRKLRHSAVRPFIIHDKYERGYTDIVYDVALLRLSRKVNFNSYPHIRPICLPDSRFRDIHREPVTLVGWGYTEVDPIQGFHKNLIKGEYRGTPSDTLQKAEIRIIGQRKCNKVFNPLDLKIDDTKLCAISGLADACNGDSGGGLVKENRGGGYTEIVGVVSFGYGCRSTVKGAPIPGVYTRVSSVVRWIQRETSSGTSCIKPSFTPGGGWGEWTSFGECSKPKHTCGVGKWSRDRYCSGSSCTHTEQTQERLCNIKFC